MGQNNSAEEKSTFAIAYKDNISKREIQRVNSKDILSENNNIEIKGIK